MKLSAAQGIPSPQFQTLLKVYAGQINVHALPSLCQLTPPFQTLLHRDTETLGRGLLGDTVWWTAQ